MNLDNLLQAWDSTSPATDFTPIPTGTYEAEAIGQLGESRTGTPRYAVKWKICNGEYEGRFAWQDLWLTPLGLPMAKRDLQKLGIIQREDVFKPLPVGRIYSVEIAVRTRDNGKKYNEVKRFSYLRTETDPFAPPEQEPEVKRDVVQDKTDSIPSSPINTAVGGSVGSSGDSSDRFDKDDPFFAELRAIRDDATQGGI
jgi:hypothetical protein